MPQARTKETDAWIPENEGEVLTGVVTDIDSAWSNFRANNDPKNTDAGWYPLLTIQTADGTEVKVHAFRTVLYNEIMRRQPQIGESVSITYVGKGKAHNGQNPPEIYRVKVEGRSASPAAYAGFAPAKGPTAGAVDASEGEIAF